MTRVIIDEEAGPMNARASDIQRDLSYVRGVVDRSEVAGPRAIWYLWAGICLVGFSLVDFAPQRVPLYWLIAGPAGFVTSAWLGWRHGRDLGQTSRREGHRHMLHWGALLVAAFLTIPLVMAGTLSGPGMGQVILLLIALGYWLAGVHLIRPLRWIGLLIAVGYLTVVFVETYAWTFTGIVVALGLAATAAFTGRSDESR